MVEYSKRQTKRKKSKVVDPTELRRKAALYNVGTKEQCPRITTQKHTSKENPIPQYGRPLTSQIGFVQDLQSTPPNNSTTKHSSKEWRLGHSNSATSFKLAGQGTDGLLVPSVGSRQVLATANMTDEFKNLILAYPPPKVIEVATDVANPTEWIKRFEAVPSTCSYNVNLPRAWKGLEPQEDTVHDKTWIPPSSPPKEHYFQTQLDKLENNNGTNNTKIAAEPLNAMPLRNNPCNPIPNYQLPEQTAQNFIRQAQKAERAYLQVEAKVNTLKDPSLMYSLPIASHGRACRLGLEALHTDVSVNLEKKKLRPKSALHAVQGSQPMVKVAGATTRPKTARLSFLRSATVYCIDTPERNTVAEYAEKMLLEKEKRKSVIGQKYAVMERNKTIVHRSIDFIFTCLRNQALLNVPNHLKALYEAMDIEDYMKLLQITTNPRPGRRSLLHVDALMKAYDAGFDSAALPPLWLDRKQFAVALQQLKFSNADINLLFNAFDFELEHKVEIGEICREIRTLQLAKQKQIMPHLLLSGDKSRLRESF
ncbi:hypothetical protein THRCLA_02934 [Thraustotheca clavata]|uniref:EF-hand domain-containing protein n=1 Tax=Thraustotheca clavata TaxID=74557 RepID=A0A1W0A3M1_9STRA|nr:hypothetical protein THRCLA_02934 [Thraustotheca clavata]